MDCLPATAQAISFTIVVKLFKLDEERSAMEGDTLNWIFGGLAIALGIGAFLMMFTTVWTSPNRK